VAELFSTVQVVKPLTILRWHRAGYGWLWLHFDSAGSDVSQFLGSKLPSAALKLLITTDDHQQLHADDACVSGVFAGATIGCGRFAFVIGAGLVDIPAKPYRMREATYTARSGRILAVR
jgi:hypothetical protein